MSDLWAFEPCGTCSHLGFSHDNAQNCAECGCAQWVTRNPDVLEIERLRAVEAAARRFLEAAALESMTKAPAYIKAKRALRRALGVESKEEGA